MAAELLAARTLGFEGSDIPDELATDSSGERIDRPLLDSGSAEARVARDFLAASVADGLIYCSPATAPVFGRSAAWTPDAQRIIVGHAGGKLSLHDAVTGDVEWEIPPAPESLVYGDEAVTFVGVLPDGSAVISTTNRRASARCHELATGKLLWDTTAF